MKIPIVILTKDENRYLNLCIRSILNRTKGKYHLFIVDNCSSSLEQKKLLQIFSEHPNITVLFNSKNEWLLGFNLALEVINENPTLNQEYIVLSDGDITVPLPKGDICWLTYLTSKLKENAHIGKLGLSLDLGYIQNNPNFKAITEKETRFMNGPISSDLVIAPVDTTLAIYRRSLFILPEFRIIPGHASLVKPYYYVMRTHYEWRAKHLGWRHYATPKKTNIHEKIVCFTRYAGYIDPVILKQASPYIRIYHAVFKKIYKMKWSFIVVYYWTIYLLKHFPRDLNELQSSVR